MTESPPHDHSVEDDVTQSAPPPNPLYYLGPNSYTARRLEHATPEHIHLTTRRCFIGPIPEGWLRVHRRDWYRHHLHIHYSSRPSTFTAAVNTGKHRKVTGLAPDTPKHKGKGSEAQNHPGQSFPQPQDIVDQHIEDALNEDEIEDAGQIESSHQRPATTESPQAIATPRTDDGLEAVPSRQQRLRGVRGLSRVDEGVDPSPDLSAIHQPVGVADDTGDASQTAELQAAAAQDPGKSEGTVNSSRTNTSSGLRTWRSAKSKLSKVESEASFVTAHEDLSRDQSTSATRGDPFHTIIMDGQADDSDANRASTIGDDSRTDSTAGLIPKDTTGPMVPTSDSPETEQGTAAPKSRRKSTKIDDSTPLADAMAKTTAPKVGTGLVRFNLPEDDDGFKDDILKMKLAQHRRRDTLKRLHKGRTPRGEIVKMEKMLVRVEYTMNEVPPDFDENESQKTDSRILDKWREFMVVCRESTVEESDYTLQMYKSRVIPATEKTHVRKRYAHEISLNKDSTHINLFSSLDKMIVMWEPYKRGTRMYIMKPRSGASAMEWFTFLRDLLGWKRPSMLQVNVPDLDISLRMDHPFEDLDSTQDLAKAAEGDQEALAKTIQQEHDAAQNLIVRCVGMLEKSPEWGDVIDEWIWPTRHGTDLTGTPGMSRVVTAHHASEADRPTSAVSTATSKRSHVSQVNGYRPVGLAWKRYDRLEWVHGTNEKSMYGSIGMLKFHDLELRPKQHYPTEVRTRSLEMLTEPPPVEGFLIRLTSQKGVEQRRLGKLFFKRLYFSTHSQYLVFNRPAQADPPPPPVLPVTEEDGKVPNAKQIAAKVPLIYAINPFPLHESQITWLTDDTIPEEKVRRHDEDAFDEDERKINLLLKSDGLINLTQVKAVRNVRRGVIPTDQNIVDGPEVDFHDQDDDEEDTRHEDGETTQMDDKRTFELVLRNGLIVRLQAYDKTTCREWQVRLRSLVEYWTLRCAADMAIFKSVRKQNLEVLNIDEEQEAITGQFAQKWEVGKSVASPELYHMCGIGCCRTVMLSGVLFRKPRLHASFHRVNVVLAHGHLMVFQDAVRSRSGKLERHIHHERVTAISLEECYIYSGLITASDLLYSASDGYEKARPGHEGGLPRMYLGDGWSSTDEDTMTCFVLWHGKRKSWFRSEGAGDGGGKGKQASAKVKLVGQLGKEGRSMVFKARSRAERDHWVMSIGMEIERLAHREDIRIVKGS